MYEYRCIVKRIVDGDTVDVDIDLGFNTWIMNQRVRLVGIDAPEVRTRDLDEKERGFEAKKFVEKMLPIGFSQILVSRSYDSEKGKYGRIIGDFKVYDAVWDSERYLTQLLLREGLAVRYE